VRGSETGSAEWTYQLNGCEELQSLVNLEIELSHGATLGPQCANNIALEDLVRSSEVLQWFRHGSTRERVNKHSRGRGAERNSGDRGIDD
jgi:hypothetical protein